MKYNIYSQLFHSFGELQKAISVAREAAGKSGSPRTVLLKRLDQYEQILDKQRALANSLQDYAAKHDWSEVSRHINIINSLSRMIRDDAREIISSTTVSVGQSDHVMQ